VALVDETLARQYWPAEDPVGKHSRRGRLAPWAIIVGVVGHVKNADLGGEDIKGKYYFPKRTIGSSRTTVVRRSRLPGPRWVGGTRRERHGYLRPVSCYERS